MPSSVAHLLNGPCQLKPRERVIVILPRLPAWWLINLACIRNGKPCPQSVLAAQLYCVFSLLPGTVLIPGTTQLTSRDIKHRILRSSADCLIVDDVTAEKVDPVSPSSWKVPVTGT